MFSMDGRDDPPMAPAPAPKVKIGRFANTPVRKVEPVQVITPRQRVTLPADIPPRPPGCGTNAPSAARHAWRTREEVNITAVTDPARPTTLPRTNIAQPYEPPPPIATPYVVFGDDPFRIKYSRTVSPPPFDETPPRRRHYPAPRHFTRSA
eukprot:TRINITY_DN39393_c0_g1_i1.p1 TRINITY_DN39393_c0_g1~~TRINITY_DN39393_c0_g1_i1.p1  ORF type:complete len:151 (+),score=1.08 TRINITY_DN39393_c0_g1_i1:52-504(+)